MVHRIFPIVVLALLMGCGEVDDAGDQSLVANLSDTSLAGNWQVAAIDGKPVVGVLLTGTDAILGWAPSCAGWMVRYQRSGQAIEFKRTGKADQVRTVCAVGYPDELPRIFEILPDMQRIEIQPDSELHLSGNGRSLTLERPTARADMAVPTMRGTWRVSSLDGNAIPEGVAPTFVADDDMISWSVRCAQQDRIYHIENDRFVARDPRTFFPPTPPPPPPLQVQPRPICAIGLPPHLEDTFKAMDAATTITRSEGHGIKLEGGNRTLTLHPINIELKRGTGHSL